MNPMLDTIELTLEQKRWLAQIAEQTGKSWPQILNEALSSFQLPPANGKQAESVAQRMRRTGLLGCIDGPTDLSSNPAYMEGFGTGGQ